MTGKYEFTPEMGEISGLHGNYEAACREMLIAGLEYWDKYPDLKPQYKGTSPESPIQIYGVLLRDNEDAKTLSKIVCDAANPDYGVTGAMHQAVIESIMWIRTNGWEAYVKAMSEKSEEGDHGDS